MKLSVIIPCFNNGVLLSKMIKCCQDQTYDDWELIIVDDQSTDGVTQNIVTNYTKVDKRIRFYVRDREPKGSVTCRNIGLSKASGQYILHFDADDLIPKTCFKERVDFMEQHPDLDYASFVAKSFSDENELPDFNTPGKTWGKLPKDCADILESFLRYDYAFSTWNNIYKRDSIIQIQWDEKIKIYTDFSFIIPCCLKGLKHQFCPSNNVSYYYRVSESNKNAMTASFISNEKCLSTIYLFKQTLIELSKRNDYKKRKAQFLCFLRLHYQRLSKGARKEDLLQFSNLISEFYPRYISTKFQIATLLLFGKANKKYELLWNMFVFFVILQNKKIKTLLNKFPF